MNEYENTYEEEINLTDLLIYCLKKWRWIVAAMLILAVLAGGYKYYSTGKSNQAALEQWNSMKPEEKEKSSVDNMGILQHYQSAIDEKARALEEQEDYLESSGVMSLDARHLQKGILSFVLKTETTDAGADILSTLLSAYRAYVTDGRLAQTLYSGDKDTAVEDSRYLLTFLVDDKLAPDADEKDTGTSTVRHSVQSVFQIQILSEDEKACGKQMDAAAKAVQLYSDELQKQVGEHELTMLASSISESQDQSIQDYQTKVLNDYTAAIRDLSNLRSEAKTYADSLDTETAAVDTLTEPALASPAKAGVKYAILGLVLGAFLAGFILIVIFLMSDRLRSTENFEKKFGMRLLGRVIPPVKGKSVFGALDRVFQRMGEGAYANLPYEEQVRIVSANVKTAAAAESGTHVMLAGTIAAGDVSEICAAVAKETEEVRFSDYRQLVFDASALEELSGYDGILFIEKKDASSARLIAQECKMATDRNVKILGTVVI